ncbi:MAG TPA: YciI family protein [Longimicrobiales bacterium]
MASTASAYLYLIRESTPEVYEPMSDEQRRRVLDRWNAWVDDLGARGVLLDANPLSGDGRVVTAAARERVVDGPYSETKELVGGYFILTCASLDEATQLALSCPSLEYGLTIEVRPIAGACHLAHSLGWQTMKEPETAAAPGANAG